MADLQQRYLDWAEERARLSALEDAPEGPPPPGDWHASDDEAVEILRGAAHLLGWTEARPGPERPVLVMLPNKEGEDPGYHRTYAVFLGGKQIGRVTNAAGFGWAAFRNQPRRGGPTTPPRMVLSGGTRLKSAVDTLVLSHEHDPVPGGYYTDRSPGVSCDTCGPLAGILPSHEPGAPTVAIERCDACERYPGDVDAAYAWAEQYPSYVAVLYVTDQRTVHVEMIADHSPDDERPTIGFAQAVHLSDAAHIDALTEWLHTEQAPR